MEKENGLLLCLGGLGLFDKAQDHCTQHTAHSQCHAVQYGVVHHREHEDAAVGDLLNELLRLVDAFIHAGEQHRLPSKRAVSTFFSAATMMPSQAAISARVRIFFAPSEPLVSTLVGRPSLSPALVSASAAM